MKTPLPSLASRRDQYRRPVICKSDQFYFDASGDYARPPERPDGDVTIYWESCPTPDYELFSDLVFDRRRRQLVYEATATKDQTTIAIELEYDPVHQTLRGTLTINSPTSGEVTIELEPVQIQPGPPRRATWSIYRLGHVPDRITVTVTLPAADTAR